MKLKYEFCFQPLGQEYVGVAVGDNAEEFSGMLQLDSVAYDMVSCLTEDITRESLIDKMFEMYDADRDVIAEQVDKIIKDLISEGVLSL